MSDSISQLGKIPAHAHISAEKPTQTTDQALPESATAEFDTATVARVKAAIAEGNYPVNSEAVAEKFAALENMIYGN
jgi:flagellar biosynthesis anti-sigma factor FlgM